MYIYIYTIYTRVNENRVKVSAAEEAAAKEGNRRPCYDGEVVRSEATGIVGTAVGRGGRAERRRMRRRRGGHGEPGLVAAAPRITRVT